MKSRFVLAGFIGLLAVILNSCATTNGTITSPTTGFMWVATQGDQMVGSYSIDLTTGAASVVGASVATGVTPLAMAITPAGDALFIANSGDNTVSAYSFNSDGSLKSTAASTPTGQMPAALEVDPTGKFLFVANQGTLSDTTSSTISVFLIQGTGLTEIAGSPFRTVPANDLTDTIGTGPSAVAVAPAGNFLYVANQFTSDISIFSYDSTGTLTLITTCGAAPNCPSPRIPAGTNPAGLAFSRCAGTATVTTNCPTAAPPSYLFVANSGSNNVSIFSACIQTTAACPSANGTLTQIAGSPVGAGTRPVSFIVDPVLDFVYAVDNGSFQVSQYKYSSATGALTILSPATTSTGASPLPGGITSDGHWVFIPNNGGSSVSAFGLNTAAGTTPSGQLGAGTAITLSSQPSAVLVR